MQTSWMYLGSMPDLEMTAWRTGFNIDSGAVSFCAPFFALVMAVLAKETMTTSSSAAGLMVLALNVLLLSMWLSRRLSLFMDSILITRVAFAKYLIL